MITSQYFEMAKSTDRDITKPLYRCIVDELFDLAMQYAYANVGGSEIVDGATLDERYYLPRNPIVVNLKHNKYICYFYP